MGPTNRHCPQCGDEVLPAMVRCRQCGFRLLETAGVQPAASSAASSLRSTVQPTQEARTTEKATIAVTPAPATSPIVTCRCGHRFRVKGEFAGRKVKCSKCGAVVAVSAESTAAIAPTPRFTTYADYATLIERQKPNVTARVVLSRTRLSWSLNRIIKRLDRQNGDNSERAGERRRAILELAATRDLRAVDVILPLTEDPWEVVRQGAAAALGDLADPSAVPALVRLLDDFEPDVKREATMALGKIGDGRATQVLHVLAVQEPALRFLATDAVVKIGNPAVPFLVQELGDPDPGAVLQSILTLQRMKATSVAEPLTKSLEHPATVIRANAAETLGLLAVRSTIPHLVKALADPHAPVRAQAAAALKRLGDRKTVKALVPLLDDADTHVRVRAVEAVGELGEAPLASAVLPSLSHPDPGVRAAAAEALRRLGNPVAVVPLLELLKDSDENVRLKAVAAISRFKSEPTVASLLNLLFDPAPAVRTKVAEALGEIGHRSATPGLQTALKFDAIVDVRMAAAKSLGKIRDPQSVTALEESLQDELAVRCRAVAALGEIAAKSSQSALLAMLRDPAPEIRFHAAQALGELGDERSARSLECLLSDESALVRRGVAKAMIKLGDPRGEKLNVLAEKQPRVRRTAQSSTQEEKPWAAIGLMVAVTVVATGGVTIWFFGGPSTPTAAISRPAAMRGRVASVAVSPDGAKVAVGRTKGLIEVWELGSGKVIDRIATDQSNEIIGIAFSTKGDSLLYTSGSQVQSVRNGKHERRKSHQQAVQGLRVGPHAKFAITWSATGDVHIWNLESAGVEASLQLKPANLPTLTIDAEGKRLAWGSTEGIATIWDVVENDRLRELKLERGPITGLAFSGDGTFLAALSPSVGVTVWDLSTGDPVRQLPPPKANEAFYQRLFFADGKRLLAQRGARIEQLSLENEDAPALIAEGRGVPTDTVAVDPARRWLVCGGPDRTAVWVFDLTSAKPPVELDEPRSR